MHSIIANVSKHIRLTPEEQDYFLAVLQVKNLKKKQALLHEGEICKSSAFVISGCLRAYTIDHNGFEHILQFAPKDWWIADMYSLITQQPATLSIDAVEATEVLLLPRTAQEELFVKVTAFERFFRIITEKALVTARRRVLDTLSLTAQQRYENFCKQYPTLIHTLPQKQIASFIGVTPEFLSKMRKELLRNK
jgi:CRP-like cAMP-binding protein